MDITDTKVLEKILNEIPSCIFFKDTECKYVFATHYWKHLNSNDDPNWSIKGKTDLDIRKDKANAMKAMEADKRILETGESTDYVIREVTDGVVEYLQLIKRPVRDDEGNIIGIVGLINDVTKQIQLEQQLSSYMEALKIESETDPLTHICNRRSGQSLVNIRTDEGIFCLFDVDKFKNVNDTFGHAAGDDVLVGIAEVLKNSFRESDMVMRLGGDEFAVFAKDIHSEAAARPVIDRFFANLEAMDIPSIGDYKITISMGICITKKDQSFEDMYNKTDTVMYIRKKERNGNGYDFV